MENKRWCCFFSQTGSELFKIIQILNRMPDVIIYNFSDYNRYEKVNNNFKTYLWENYKIIERAPFNPTIEDYYSLLKPNDIITLHGWLRIIPPKICNSYNIYNGHPGLISKYPELKGKDPQKKAYELKLKTSGCVIHRVIPKVDAGEVIVEKEVNIENLGLEDIINVLHDESIKLWTEFLKEKI